MRQDDAIVLTTYGRSSGYCVDPIEKKPLNHFLPGSAVLSFGTAGCNLGCRFCQNWDISKSRETDTLAGEAAPPAIARAAARRLNGDGRCVSCGTPLAGVFDGPPGTWGPKWMPVQIANH
jgi:pyruvate-formate lyase-activating enzyme